VRYATKRQFWGHDRIIGLFVDAVLGKGPSPVPLAESLDVVRFTDELLDRLGLDADVSKLPTG